MIQEMVTAYLHGGSRGICQDLLVLGGVQSILKQLMTGTTTMYICSSPVANAAGVTLRAHLAYWELQSSELSLETCKRIVYVKAHHLPFSGVNSCQVLSRINAYTWCNESLMLQKQHKGHVHIIMSQRIKSL